MEIAVVVLKVVICILIANIGVFRLNECILEKRSTIGVDIFGIISFVVGIWLVGYLTYLAILIGNYLIINPSKK